MRTWLAKTSVRVALGGYLLLGLFICVQIVILEVADGVGRQKAWTIAALAVAPLGLAMIWSRLVSFRGFGFEVQLSEATTTVDVTLSTTVVEPTLGSATPDLVSHVGAVFKSHARIMLVNLRDGEYWWDTRLFLLAALADDLSAVQQLLFVDRDDLRRFVGTSTPSDIRRALANQRGELESVYSTLSRAAEGDPGARAEQIVYGWTARMWGEDNRTLEGDFADRLSPRSLSEAVAAVNGQFDQRSLEWPGLSTIRIREIAIDDFSSRFVVLTRFGHFDAVIDRYSLASGRRLSIAETTTS